MKFGLFLYRIATFTAAPVIFLWFYHRTRNGKESRDRLHERHARSLPNRPAGKLVWLHGASIGECKLLLAVVKALQAHRPDLGFLLTSQTASAAKIIADQLPDNTQHQMAPLDTPAISRRFISHWRPDLFVLAESEIWPNLLGATQLNGTATALINARMTESSLARWQKYTRSAQKIFSQFDLINVVDKDTAALISTAAGRQVATTCNLKIGAAAPSMAPACTANTHSLSQKDEGKLLLGASTHAGEEALLIDAFKTLPPDTRLILAPRHAERVQEISTLLDTEDIPHAIRSKGGNMSDSIRVLIADTFGEMDLWYSRADIVYLGGGQHQEIGGHNPIEPLSYGKPVLSGSHTKNFADIFAELRDLGMIHTVSTSAEIASAFNTATVPDRDQLERFVADGKQQFDQTIASLLALLEQPAP